MTHPAILDRRSLLGQLALLLGAASLPTEALAARAAGAQAALAPAQRRLLAAVADTIVPRTDTPGALDAGVPARFERLLQEWASPRRRSELGAALDRIAALARAQTGTEFDRLPAPGRFDLLAAHDAASLRPVPRTDGLTGIAAQLSGPAVADPGYAMLKQLIVTLYYLSEPALTYELQYEHNPGTWRPSVPLTPDSRASGGSIGMF